MLYCLSYLLSTISSITLLPMLGSISSESYPEILSLEEEKKYLEAWAKKDEDARKILIEHNLRLVAHIVKKFENTKEDKDDLLSIGAFGLIKAVDSYNINSNTRLATYASRCIENEILMHLRKIKSQKQITWLSSPIGTDKEGNEITLSDIIIDESPTHTEKIIKDEKTKKIRESLKILNDRELEIINARFGFNNHPVETQKEISERLNISRSYVSRIEKRALSKIYIYLNKQK